VRFAAAAIEAIGTLALLELACHHVAANAIARQQILKIRMPADGFRPLRPQGTPRSPHGSHYRHQDSRHHQVERAEKDHMS
jgi:hypothetical protein